MKMSQLFPGDLYVSGANRQGWMVISNDRTNVTWLKLWGSELDLKIVTTELILPPFTEGELRVTDTIFRDGKRVH
jgi:hypothetical protein